ncbi:mucin-binding protein [Fructobacillus fructosus]|uniref:mucin-binding protein n=1 Tax=Fructobacillus fructosus TaxID=1631 RepID=UPI0002195286|nr:BspA family leucine-rich repeat surface protein [Fructobacillus fructosus]
MATHDQVETKTTTRTIKLVDKDTKQEIANVEPIKQTINWTRTNKVDDQGNVVSEGTWQAVDQNGQYATLMYKDLDLSSKGYTTPQIDGKDVTKADAKNASGQTITENDDKTADGQDVVKVKAEAADVNKGDEEVTVTYTKAATTANTTSTQAAQTTAAAAQTTTEATGTKEVTNTKTTTRTIKYVAPDYDDQEMAKTVTQTINWKQVNTVDATGKVVKEGTWEVADSSNGKYAAVTTPTVANFTVDQAMVAEQKATADDKDQTITVKYSFAGATEAADTPELRATQKGSYGSVDYTYDTSTDTLTFTTTGSFPDTNAGGTIFDKFPNVKHIVFNRGVYAAANSSSLFANLRKLKDFTNLDKLDTSRTRDMSYMFSMGAIQNTSLRNLDLSSFDTSKVTSMQFMFQNLGALYHLDISSFKMSAATDAAGDSQMFDLLGDGNTIYVKLPSQHFNTLADLGSVDGATGGDSKYPTIVPIGNGSLDQPQGPGMSTDAYRKLFDTGKHPGGWYMWGRDTKWTERKTYTQTIRAVDSKGNVIKTLRVETGEFIRSASKNYITNKITGEFSSWKLDTDVRSEYSEYELPQSFTLDNVNYTTPTINGTHRYWIGTRDIKQSDEVEDVIYAADVPTDNHGTDTDQTITRKVHLRDESNGNAEFDADNIATRTETIHFHRSGTVNSLTGVFTPTTSWAAVDGSASFAGYAAPDMKAKGYDLDKPATTDAITPSQADITSGKSYDQDVFYKHHTGKVTPDGPVGPVDPDYPPVDPANLKKQLTKTYTRTVHFIDATGKKLAADKVETITATGEADYDYVTGQIVGDITWSYQSDSDKDWEAVTPAASINLDGKYYYDPQSDQSLAQKSFDIQNDAATNEDVNVTYKTGTDTSESKTIQRVVHLRDASDGNAEFDQDNLADRTQTLTFTRAGYKDEEGNFHATGEWVAEPSTDDSFAAFKTPDETAKGYDFDRNATTAVTPSQDDITNGVSYNQDIFYTHHKGKITPDGPVGPVDPVYPPVNPDAKKQLVKAYTRTVHFVGTDGKTVAPDRVETVTANGEADYDYVTGQIVGAITWSYKAGSDETWAVVTPQATIDANGKHYYNPSANGSLAEMSFDVQNDAATNADITVTYQTATPTDNHGTDTDKTAIRHVKLIDDTEGHEFDAGSVADSTISYHRDGYIDDATGAFIPAGDWTVVGGGASEFAGVDAPDKSSEGYDAGTPAKTDSVSVDKDSVNNGQVFDQEIHYNHHKANINPNTPKHDPKVGPDIPQSVLDSLVKEYKRTVHFKNRSGADLTDAQIQEIIYNGDAEYDYVTQKLVSTPTWTLKSGSADKWTVVNGAATIDKDGTHYVKADGADGQDPEANKTFDPATDAAIANQEDTIWYDATKNGNATDTDKDVSRTIYFQTNSGKTLDEETQTVHFHRDGYINETTNKFVATSDWYVQGTPADMAAVAAKDFRAQGYVPDTAKQTSVDALTPDKEATSEADQTIWYKDNTGNITPNTPKHDPNNGPDIPDAVLKSLVKTYTRTVHFVGDDGKTVAPDEVETVTAYGEAEYDYATQQIIGNITWSYKTGSDEEWAVVTPKSTIDLDGKHYYAPSSNGSLAATSFDVQKDAATNADVTVTYKTATPTNNHGTDTDKSVVRHVKLIDAKTNQEFDAGTVADATLAFHRDGYVNDKTGEFIPAGDWIVVGGGASEFAGVDAPDKSSEGYDAGTPATTATVDVDKDTAVNGHVYEQTITYNHHSGKITPDGPVGPVDPVYPPVNPDAKKQLVKTYTRTVHFVGTDGKKVTDDQVETITANGEADYDYVTGQIDGPITWSYKAGSDEEWAVVTPKSTVDANGKHYYAPEANGSLAATSFNVQNDAAQNADVTVTYKTATPTNNHGTDTDKSVIRHVKLIDGKTGAEFDKNSVADATLAFHRDGYVNDKTGEFIPAGDWTVVGGGASEFSGVDAPNKASEGYDAGTPAKTANIDVDKETAVNGHVYDQEITYNHHSGKITPDGPVGPINPNGPVYPPVNPDVKKQLVKTYTRTVHFVGSDGKTVAPDKVETVTAYGEADYDYVTGQIDGPITWSYKSGSAESWAVVTPAATIDANGKHYYDPSSNGSLAEKSFDVQNDAAQNADVTVTYKTATPTNNHGADTDKSVIRHVKLIDGKTGNEFDAGSVADSTLSFHRDGYVDDATGAFFPAGGWTVVGGGASEFAGVDAPDKASEGYDAGTPAKTANIDVDKDTAVNGHVYEQEITYNHHSGKITPDGPVGPVDPHGPVYPPVNPDVKKQLVKTYTRTVHFVGTDGKTVAPDQVETVTANGEADYDYVTGQIDGPITWSYKAGSAESWSVVTPAATIDANGKHYYAPVANGSLAEKSFDVQNDAAENTDVTVTYKTATPTNNHGADTDKTATRQFHLIDDTDGHEFDADSINDRTQTVHFHRDGFVDDATGDFIPAGDWQAVDGDGNFAAYTAPDESQKGYDLVSASEIAGQNVDKETVVNGENINVDIHYKHHKSHIGPNTPDDPKHGPKIPDAVRQALRAEVKRNIHFKDAGNPNGEDIALLVCQ